MIYILIMAIATSSSVQSGASLVSTEFHNEAACERAARLLVQNASQRGNYVLTYGCFSKG